MTILSIAPCSIHMPPIGRRLPPFSLLIVLFCASMTLSLTGCAIRGNGQTIAYVVDGATIAAGIAILVESDNDCLPESDFDRVLPVAPTACSAMSDIGTLLGGSLLLGGGIGLIANMAVNHDSEVESEPLKDVGLITQAAAPSRKPPSSTFCSEPILAWRAETDYRKRYELFRKLPMPCQREITGQ